MSRDPRTGNGAREPAAMEGEGRPLSGLTFLNPREAQAAPALSEPLQRLGGEVIEAPTVAFAPPASWQPFDDMLAELDSVSWLVLTSATALRFALSRAIALGHSPQLLSQVPIAVIGRGTEREVGRHGLQVGLRPVIQQAEGLLEELRERLHPGDRVWIPRAEKARPVLEEGLREAGAEVVITPVYRTVMPEEGLGPVMEALWEGAIDWLVFTSSTTVEHLFRMLPGYVARRLQERPPRVACLGRVTAETARSLGLEVTVVPERQDVEGLVAAMADRIIRERSA